MPYNPSTSRAECNYHAGMVNQDSKNQPQTSNRESYNTFDKRHSVADTQLFDEVRPFYMDMANSGDVKRARMVNNDWSPVTKSQILSDIKKHRALFQVPWSVIMPNTWEYLYREPVQGADIVQSNVFPLITKATLVDIFKRFFANDFTGASTNYAFYLEGLIKAVWLYYSMFGASSLPQTLGVRILSPDVFKIYSDNGVLEYDISPEAVFSRLVSVICDAPEVKISVGGQEVSLNIGGTFRFTPAVVESPTSSVSKYTYSVDTPAEAFNFIRDFIFYSSSKSLLIGGNITDLQFFYIANYVFYGVESYSTAPSSFVMGDSFTSIVDPVISDIPSDFVYNLMPVIAYQCVWYQFFTNDRVDDVYSAKMFHDNVNSFVLGIAAVKSFTPYFSANGISVMYDPYSAAVVSMMASLIGADINVSSSIAFFDYFIEIFTIRPSMRRSDYFTSMRVRPLAVGDVNVTVASQQVSAIDINKSLWYQRFLNAVNRTKQSIYDYLQSITGVLPERREPQPNFIVEETFSVAGMQVDNNSENQGKIVSILRNSQSNYLYDIFIDEPSFIIGVDSYSVDYLYPDSCNRIAFMSDRLDWFNDFMQHIGDQDVKVRELFTPSSLATLDNPVGYQLRYAEFKNAISRACGGFLSDDTDLASWLLLYAPNKYLERSVNSMSVISPYFIRNHCSDFDNLFDALSGTNPTNRFHVIKYTFVDEYDNSKQQAYPSLL